MDQELSFHRPLVAMSKFDARKSQITEATLVEFLQAEWDAPLRDVPGIGAKTEQRLAAAGITCLYQLSGIAMTFRTPGITTAVWCNKMWDYLVGHGLSKAHLHGLINALFEKLDLAFPGTYVAGGWGDEEEDGEVAEDGVDAEADAVDAETEAAEGGGGGAEAETSASEVRVDSEIDIAVLRVTFGNGGTLDITRWPDECGDRPADGFTTTRIDFRKLTQDTITGVCTAVDGFLGGSVAPVAARQAITASLAASPAVVDAGGVTSVRLYADTHNCGSLSEEEDD